MPGETKTLWFYSTLYALAEAPEFSPGLVEGLLIADEAVVSEVATALDKMLRRFKLTGKNAVRKRRETPRSTISRGVALTVALLSTEGSHPHWR